jgi:transposase
MRFVPIKTDDQLDLQSLHRVRERWVGGRTAVINQMRGLLLERGITIRKGRRYIEEALPRILEDADNKVSGALRVLLTQLQLETQYQSAHRVGGGSAHLHFHLEKAPGYERELNRPNAAHPLVRGLTREPGQR